MSAIIPAQSAAFVQNLIDSGAYGSEAEVVAAALLSFEQSQQQHARLRAQLLPAIEQLSRGEGELLADEDIDSFFDEVIAEAECELGGESRGN